MFHRKYLYIIIKESNQLYKVSPAATHIKEKDYGQDKLIFQEKSFDVAGMRSLQRL